MTLSAQIDKARRNRATRANRQRQERAETRIDEIGAVADIATVYATADRAGDLEIEQKFTELYQLVNSDEERAAVARAFSVWIKTEQAEDDAVHGSVGRCIEFIKSHNPLFIDGSFVPGDSDGAA